MYKEYWIYQTEDHTMKNMNSRNQQLQAKQQNMQASQQARRVGIMAGQLHRRNK